MKPTYIRNFESIASQQFNIPHFIVQTQSTNFEILSSSSYLLKIFLHIQMAHVCVCVNIYRNSKKKVRVLRINSYFRHTTPSRDVIKMCHDRYFTVRCYLSKFHLYCVCTFLGPTSTTPLTAQSQHDKRSTQLLRLKEQLSGCWRNLKFCTDMKLGLSQ